VTDLERLLAEKQAADAALAEIEAALLASLVAAKDAHRSDPNEATRAAKAEAVADVRAYRAVVRAGRSQLVAGDSYVSEG
jgi:hypothetical protein